MAVSVGSLFIDLRASTKGLKKDVDKAVQKTRRLINKGFKTAFVAGIAGAAALAASISQAADRIDHLAKTADKLGVPIQRLQALQRAGELTGVSVNTMNMAVQRMTRRVSEAANGTGEAVKALKELGLDAQQLANMSPDKQFQSIANAMQNVSSQGDRVRLAMRLFDSEGVSLVNTLAQGSAFIDETAKRLTKLGVTLSRIDAAKVEMAGDAFSELKLVSQGVTNQLAIQFAPVIKEIATLISDSAAETGGFKDRVISFVDVAVTGFAYVGNVLRGWEVIVKTGRVAYAGYFELILRGAVKVGQQIESMVISSVAAFNKLIIAANDKLGTEFETVNLRQFGKIDQRLNELAKDATAARKQLQLELEKSLSEPLPTAKVDEWLASVRQKTDEAAIAIAEIAQKSQAATDIPPISEETAKVTSERFQALGESVKTNFTDPVHESVRSLNQGIDGLVRGTTSWTDALTNVAQTLVSTVLQSFVQMAAAWLTQQVVMQAGIQTTAATGAAAAATAGAASASAGAASAAAWIPAAIAASIATFGAAAGTGLAAFSGAMITGTLIATALSALSTVATTAIGAGLGQGRAHGGHVNVGTTYPIHEQGLPEFFKPDVSGKVIPLAKMDMPDGVGGNIFNLNYTFTGGVTEKDLVRILPELEKKTVSGILELVQRGGTFRRKMQA
jgi:hypothetical protein